MTAEFAQDHHDLLIPSLDEEIFGSPQWILAETVRRTVFVVHAINVLSARVRRQHTFFYEPLDDDLVLDMPLPVPEEFWRVHSGTSLSPSPFHPPKRLSASEMLQLSHAPFVLGENDAFLRLILATCSPSYMNVGRDTSA